MKEKLAKEAMVNLIIERFDDLEEETGTDFTHAKRIVLRLAKNCGLFEIKSK